MLLLASSLVPRTGVLAFGISKAPIASFRIPLSSRATSLEIGGAQPRFLKASCRAYKLSLEESILSSSAHSDSDEGSDEDQDAASGDIDPEVETLSLLEWPLVCEQIAGFCITPMGVSAARDAKLPIGKTQEESEELQIQTADAEKLGSFLDFSGAKDVKRIIERAISGEACRISELCLVKDTLQCAERLHKQLFAVEEYFNNEGNESSTLVVSPLQMIMRDLDLCTDLKEDIDNCLDCKLEAVLDRASPKLAEVRKRRQDNMVALEALLKVTARKVMDAGGIDSMTVTRRRARLCVAVRASHKSLLPGGVVLNVSNTGATLFMEPEPALKLNNLEMQLAGAEQAEELAILRGLTNRLVKAAPSILALSNAITLLDLACARAKHAKWLGAGRPAFCDKESLFKDVHIEQIRHPVLLASALSQKGREQSKFPVPIDILVKHGVKAVIISGPNTGGKTVALKTLGIAAIMAKAGLYLPASGKPQLPWFDHVLADVGDSQSLEQNLSTFSGHIRRLCRIVEASGMHSLVLIDEIGGGTDPSEGSSLATALLKYLAKTVLLCFVTTHSASLKTLHEQDLSFQNASVEFDLKTLRPTYRILWGIGGQSNALNIAKSLQFDSKILERASYWLTKLTPSGLEARQTDLMVQLTRQSDEEENHARGAAAYLAEIQKLHQELNAEAENLVKRKAGLKLQEVAAMNREISEAKSRMDAIISRFREGSNKDIGGKTFTLRGAQDAITAIVAEYAGPSQDAASSTSDNSGISLPEVGERVMIRRLGKKSATVVEPADGSGHLTVQLGSMQMRVKTSELTFKAKGTSGKQVKKKAPVFQESTLETASVKFGPAVQTSRNTVDMRGLTVEDAMQVVRNAIAQKEPGSVLFIIHGIGTGALKRAVVSFLERHPNVVKFEDQSFVNGGCTVAYIA